jgi:hypothetical protein
VPQGIRIAFSVSLPFMSLDPTCSIANNQLRPIISRASKVPLRTFPPLSNNILVLGCFLQEHVSFSTHTETSMATTRNVQALLYPAIPVLASGYGDCGLPLGNSITRSLIPAYIFETSQFSTSSSYIGQRSLETNSSAYIRMGRSRTKWPFGSTSPCAE